jgi:PAS domain S-box-containing protein
MQGSPTPISTKILSPVGKILASAVQSRWFSISLGALAVAFITTLAAATLLANSALSLDTVSLLRTALGAALLVALAFCLIGSRIRIGQMQARAQAWERSLESMNVGIALYDREDRLLNCNAAFRAMYPEVAHLLVPGARLYDVATEYYKLAPADVIDGQSLEQYLAEVGRRRSGSEVTEVVSHHHGRWLLTTDCRTEDGGIISFRRDVTEQKLIEHELSKRRKLIDDLSELTYEWFWRQDAEGRFVEFSDFMERYFKQSCAELIGKRRSDMPAFEAAPEAYAQYLGQIERREPISWFTYKTKRGDGTTMWAAVTGKPIFDQQGQFQGYYGAGRDVTEREQTLAALRESEERFRALALLVTEWYWETDSDHKVTRLSGPVSFEERAQKLICGRRLREIEGLDPSRTVNWEQLNRDVAERRSFKQLKLKLHPDHLGRDMYFEVSGHAVFERGEFVGYRGLAWDVTERESLIAKITDNEARFRALTELSSDWYWEMDENLRFTRLQRGERDTFNLQDGDVIGKHRWELSGELIRPSSWDEHRATLLARKPFRDVMFRRWMPDGSFVYHVTSGDPIFSAEGKFIGYRGIGKNITEQVKSQERIERLATVDELTQLSNRQTFDERAGRILANAYAGEKRCALLFIDLDNFRLLNNGYGHRVGDQMLSIVASRISNAIGEPHLVGRRGGDELVALLVDIPRGEYEVYVAKELIRSISEPTRQ